MNRESKRMMDRRNRGGDGTAAADDDLDAAGFAELADIGTIPAARRREVQRHRTTPIQFAREIRDELRQVAWPSRVEMVNYSLVVFFTLVIMIALIFLLNYAFGKGVFYLFQK